MQKGRIGGEDLLRGHFKFKKPKQAFSLILILAFLFGNFFVSFGAKAMLVAPSGDLYGLIKDSQTGSALANVSFEINNQPVVSDENGNYTFSVDYCNYSSFELTINLTGYDTKKIENVNVPCWGSLELDIELSPTPEWRQDLQPGDILYDPYSYVVGHAGLYIGDGKVVEAQGDPINTNSSKVKETSITTWDYPERSDTYLLRVKKPSGIGDNQWQEIKDNAIQFAIGQEGKAYNWHWWTKHSDPDSSSWYCSELVWAAYYNQGIDLEYHPETTVVVNPVSPIEIFKDDDIYIVNQHLTHDMSGLRKYVYIMILSPVDVTVTDDSGNIASKDTISILGAIFIQNDIDLETGHFHDSIVLPNDGAIIIFRSSKNRMLRRQIHTALY